mmetsp:Transcript_7771/g.17917  ORF Transcript_7771/g.17917 Transcript_7771/m.17917 type:complete len:135 (-) Transcript_7771:467-871(-)
MLPTWKNKQKDCGRLLEAIRKQRLVMKNLPRRIIHYRNERIGNLSRRKWLLLCWHKNNGMVGCNDGFGTIRRSIHYGIEPPLPEPSHSAPNHDVSEACLSLEKELPDHSECEQKHLRWRNARKFAHQQPQRGQP